MVEIPQITNDSTFEENISWEDVRGLSWLIVDEENIDSKVSSYAVA